MRPLLIAAPPSSALGTTLSAVVDQAVRAGDEPHVVALGRPVGPTSFRGATVTRLHPSDTAGLAAVVADRPGPDLVHLLDPASLGPDVVRAALGLDRPLLASHHGRRGVRDLLRSQPRAGTALPPTSPVLVPCLAAVPAGPPDSPQHRLWRPGVDLALFGPGARVPALVDRWRGRDDLLLVGHVGEVKGDNVLRRLAEVAALPGVRLVVCRGGDRAVRLRERFPGVRLLPGPTGHELAQVLASLDLLVAPRRKDLECHAARQALASGLPVLGLDGGGLGGLGDLVADGVNGLLSGPRETHGLRDLVRRVRRDPALLASMAGRARDSVAGRSWADAYAELRDVHWASVLTGTMSVWPPARRRSPAGG